MPQTKAVEQFNAKAQPSINLCGCMGQMVLPGQPQCTGDNWDELKRYPVCPCAMQWVEEVDGSFYRIQVDETGAGVDAVCLGPVGGPYTLD